MIVLVAKYHVRSGNADTVAAGVRKMAPLVAKNELLDRRERELDQPVGS